MPRRSSRRETENDAAWVAPTIPVIVSRVNHSLGSSRAAGFLLVLVNLLIYSMFSVAERGGESPAAPSGVERPDFSGSAALLPAARCRDGASRAQETPQGARNQPGACPKRRARFEGTTHGPTH